MLTVPSVCEKYFHQNIFIVTFIYFSFTPGNTAGTNVTKLEMVFTLYWILCLIFHTARLQISVIRFSTDLLHRMRSASTKLPVFASILSIM